MLLIVSIHVNRDGPIFEAASLAEWQTHDSCQRFLCQIETVENDPSPVNALLCVDGRLV